MEAPRALIIVEPHNHFTARTGNFDVYDAPYYCRGCTQAGRRCSRSIAASRVSSLPNYTGKGLVAFWRSKDCYGNKLAAYYCWQHTAQANFVPVPMKRASVVKEESLCSPVVETFGRKALADKDRNTTRGPRAEAENGIKVEKVTIAEASSDCRAIAVQRKPARINTAAKAKSPKTGVVSPISPALPRKVDVYRDSAGSDESNGKTQKVKAESVDPAFSAKAIKRRDTETAELKAVNVHLLAAVQDLASQVESLKSQMQTMEAKQEKEKRVEVAPVAVKQDGQMKSSVGEINDGSGAPRTSPGSSGKQSSVAEYYKPEKALVVDKKPLVAVEVVDVESGLRADERSPGIWRRMSKACCPCM